MQSLTALPLQLSQQLFTKLLPPHRHLLRLAGNSPNAPAGLQCCCRRVVLLPQSVLVTQLPCMPPQVCTVFAQLTVGGTWQGPHVFVVRLRDDSGKPMPGVRIQDNGPKAGLNGVDNGQIWFDHVRVPRTALLNRFADVAEDGTYSSSIPSLTARFGVVVGGLTVGELAPRLAFSNFWHMHACMHCSSMH